MTTLTLTTATPEIGPDGAGLHALAARATETAAARLGLTLAQVERAMALSAWTTAAEMIEREFLGTYRGYFPKCGMAARNEAVIAEVFDAIAEATGDPRRALRAGTYTPPPRPPSPTPSLRFPPEGRPMGEGLCWSRDGRTAYLEPFDDLDPEDHVLWQHAWFDLGEAIAFCLSDAWERVPRRWKRTGERVVMRNGLHEVWLVEDSYARVHVTFGVRGDLHETEALARATMPDRAEAFFDRLALHYDLRVRTSAWTSAARAARPTGEAVA